MSLVEINKNQCTYICYTMHRGPRIGACTALASCTHSRPHSFLQRRRARPARECRILTYNYLNANSVESLYSIPVIRPWWRHQMEIFSALLAICAGNSPVTGEFPSQRQWRGALMFSLICLNKGLSKQSWGWWFETPSSPLWRHCNELGCSPCPILYGLFSSVEIPTVLNLMGKYTLVCG